MPSIDALADEVRRADRSAYLALLFAPEAARPALTALAAYRLELQRIVARVGEPLAAEIRLQWWRDAIRGEGYGDVAGVALVDALREGMARYGWPADTLCAVSEAHIHDLYADPFDTPDAFDGYAGETEGALTQLAAMALGVEALGEEAGLAAARTAATASGYAGVVLTGARALMDAGSALAAGRTLIPASLWTGGAPALAAALASGRMPEGADAALAALAAHTIEADAHMRQLAPAIDASVRAAFVRAFAAAPVLANAARSPHSVARPGPLKTQWHIWRAARTLRSLRRDSRNMKA